MTLVEIIEMPTVKENIHESCFQAYHVLNKVMEMVERGDSKETIMEIVDIISNQQFNKGAINP